MTFNNAGHKKNSLHYLMWFFIIISLSSFAQPYHIEIPQEFSSGYNNSLEKFDKNTHTSIFPFYTTDFNANDDTLIFQQYFAPIPETLSVSDRLLNYHWFEIHKSFPKNKLNIYADPLLNMTFGLDFKKNDFYFNTNPGFTIKADNGKNFAFSLDLTHTFSQLDPVTRMQADTLKIISGSGFAHKSGKFYEFTGTKFYGTFKPSQYFLFEAGFGKHFLGDGYRSLLLSENAYNYPYFKIESNFWKFKYMVLWTQLKDLRFKQNNTWSDFENKFAVFHYLNWNVSKRVSFGFFESIVCKTEDSTITTGVDFNYLNPVIFFRPVEFSIGSPNNSIMGVNAKFKLSEKIILYGQYLIDDFVMSEIKQDVKHLLQPEDSTINYGYWTNKQGYQLGFKWYDALVKNLMIQVEWNAVRPFTYSHRDVYQNFGHYNQALAHPLGANFKEGIIKLQYQKNKIAIGLKVINAIAGLDSTGTHFGQNIYNATFDSPIYGGNIIVPQYKNHIGQGIRTNLQNVGIKISYLINPKNNLRAETGIEWYLKNNYLQSSSSRFIYFGIKTSFGNNNVDYLLYK